MSEGEESEKRVLEFQHMSESDFQDFRPGRHLIRVMSRQKEQKDKKRVPFCDVRAVSYSCDILIGKYKGHEDPS